MAIPLLLGAAKGLLGNTTKRVVKGKAKQTAKNFGGRKKGGALVKKTKTVGSSKKAKVKPQQTYTGASVSNNTSSSKAKIVGGGDVSYEKLTEQLNNIVNLSSSLEKAFKVQSKEKEKTLKKKDKTRQKEKRENREGQLESSKTRSGSIGGGIFSATKKFGIMNFLLNTLMGGLAVLFLKNFESIKNFFSELGEAFSNRMNLLRWGLTSLNGPVSAAGRTVVKVFKPLLKKMGTGLKKGLSSVGKFVGTAFKKLGVGIFRFAQNILGRVTGVGSTAAKTAVRSGTRGATNAAARTAARTATKSATKSAAQRQFGKQGAKRLALFSKAFKRIPILGSIIGIGIDLAMGESLDRAVVGAIGASIGSTIGAFIGQGLIPIPFVGAGVGALVGGGIGDYLAKKLYSDFASNLTGEGLSPLGDTSEITSKMIKDRRNMKAGDQKQIQGKTMVWNGLQFVTPQQYQQQTGKAPNTTNTSSRGTGFGGSGRQQQIYNYLKSKGMSHNHAMGLMANIDRESSFRTDPGKGSAGEIGMFQWNPQVGRAQRFEKAVPDWKTNWKAQIDYALGEFKGPEYLRKTFGSEKEAADWWMNNWEIPGDPIGASRKQDAYLKSAPITGSPTSSQALRATSQVTTSTTIQDLYRGGSNTSQFPTTSGYGMRKHPIHGDMRMHSGVDIAPPGPGYYVGLKVPGKVTRIGNDARGYGKFVIISSDQTGMSYMFAHMATIDVKMGEAYTGQPIGEMGTTGGSTGIHLHYEVYKGGKDGPAVNPEPYMNLLTMGKIDGQVRSQTAQISPNQQTPNQGATVSSRPSYDPRSQSAGGGVIPIPVGGQSSMPGGGNRAPSMGGASTQQVLNSYYKSQLLGFLYKQG